MRTIDLNADLGEEITDDEGLLAVVSSANVACGFHAGSDAIMRAVCERAAALGVSVGAQVSYADRENFGRVDVEVAPAVLCQQVADQVGALSGHARAAGTWVRYLKPHGALYHRVAADEERAAAVLEGSGELPVLGMPGSRLVGLAEAQGRRGIVEGFPDRAYDGRGGLLPRSEPGAVRTDPREVAARAVALSAQVESLCVHGDSPGAVATAIEVRRALEAVGLELEGL